MIPRTIPKKTFIGESVNEASFIASKGIDETKAPTQRDSVGNMKNLEVNFDGSVSPRCPLMAYINLSQNYKYINKTFSGDYVCLKNTASPYKICVVKKGTNNIILLEVPEPILNADIKVINTASSTIIQNCDLGNELATFKIYTIGSADSPTWKSEKMIIDVDTISGDEVKKVNPNLMSSNPYSFRDDYNSYAISALGILPYIKGTFDENNKEFTVDNTTPVSDITVKELTESGNYRIIESLPKLGSTFNFKAIYLKCFLNISIKKSGNARYFISWQRTTDGIAWEPANTDYVLPTGSDTPDANHEIINVPVGYIDGTKDITDPDAGITPYMFKKFDINARENDLISTRPDVFIIYNASDLEYKYRCLLYVLVSDTTIHTSVHADISINNIDGVTSATNGYYIPAYNSSRTTRTFSISLHPEEVLNDAEITFHSNNFTCKVYSKHTYNEMTLRQEIDENNAYELTGWSISKDNNTNVITITGRISLDNTYGFNTWTTKQIALHYVSYIVVYYNNMYVNEVRFKEIIPLKNINDAPTIPSSTSESPISIDLGNLYYTGYDSADNKYKFSSDALTNYASLVCTDASYNNKIQKMPDYVSFTAELDKTAFINNAAFYDITSFSGSGTYYEPYIRIYSMTRTGSRSTEVDFTFGGTVSSEYNTTIFNKLRSFWDGSGIDSSYVRYELQTKKGTSYFTDAYGFREAFINDPSLNAFCHIKTIKIEVPNNNAVFTNNFVDNMYIDVGVYPNSTIIPSTSNKSCSGRLQTKSNYIWITPSIVDALFAYTSITNINYIIKESEDYNNYTGDNATYSVPPNYSDGDTPLSGLEAVSLNGTGTEYSLLRNNTDKLSVFYLDLGCNNANKGHKLYWNHRIVSYGDFNNNILFSDSDSLVTPLLNTLTLNASQDTQITTLVPWRNYLITATKEAIYLIYEMEDGLGHKAVNTFIGIPEQDRRTCKAILNGIIFKSNNKVYTLQPGLYSNDDSVLNIAEISQPIESLLASIKLPDNIPYDREDINFAISTSKYYYLFIPGYPDGITTCFKYDYVRRIWTTLEFPVIVKDYIQTTEDELYLITEDNAILHFEKDFTFFVKDIKDSDNDEVPDTDAIYGDYLQGVNSPPTPISFVLDSGQKTDNISTTKQFVETKLLAATMDNMDSFPLDVDIYIDGIQYKKIHTDINTDGAVLKKTTEDGLILGTNTTTDDIDLINTFRQLILRYSGKGKSIRHIISGSTLYNFKIYVTYYRYKLTHNKQ